MKKVTTEIDPIDMVKLERMAGRAGLTASEAAEIIFSRGVDFFLGVLVGATKSR